MGTSRLRALLTLALGWALLAALLPAATQAEKPANALLRQQSIERGTRVLVRAGYTDPRVTCRVRHRRATACTWDAVRELSTCTGRLAVDRKRRAGRWVRLRAGTCEPVLVGFNTYVNEAADELQRKTGVGVRRIIAPWTSVERAPGLWTWQELDWQYKLAVDNGIRPLLIAVAAPCWARPRSGCLDGIYSYPPDGDHEDAWAEYVKRLTARYPKAIGIEVWNEPNLTQVFAPKPDPERFTTLLRKAYDAVKSVDPAMPVISGGVLANDVEGEGLPGIGDRTFVRRMMAAGAGRYMDAMGVHPYPEEKLPDGTKRWNPAVAQQTVEHLRAIAAQEGFPDLPVWITEVGESTGTQPGFPAAVTPAQQGADLLQIIHNAVRSRHVPVVIVHTLADERGDAAQQGLTNITQPTTGIAFFYNGVASGFGVYDADLKPKPAACALSRALGGTLNC